MIGFQNNDEDTGLSPGSFVDGEDKSDCVAPVSRKNTVSDLILSDYTAGHSQNVEHLSPNAPVLYVQRCQDIKAESELQNTDLISKFSRNMCLHDNFVPGSSDQDQTSLENNYNATEPAYIFAVATVPGDMAGKLKFSQSQAIHKLLLDKGIVVENGIDQLSVLVDRDIKHQVLLRDGCSVTNKWGPEPYFYVKVTGSETTIYGVAALLGTIFDQNAIGITHPLTDDDHRTLHPYFTVSSTSSIPRDTAIKIMQRIRKRCPELSGQLDTSGNSIEFHDFESSSNCTSAKIKQVLSKYFHQIFEVEAKFMKSSLFEKSDYEEALAKCDMRFRPKASDMRLVRTHTIYFYQCVHKNARCCIL